MKRLKLIDPLKGLSWMFTFLNIFSKKYLDNLRMSGADIDKIIEERFTKAKNKLHNLKFFK